MATLPALYDRWMTSLLGEPVDPEPQSTCSDCAMCPGRGANRRPATRTPLRFELKCCTYTPTFPNYQIGALLLGGGPQRDVILRRIGGGREVTPMGLGVPAVQQGIDSNLVPYTGLHEEQRCPHVVTGEDGGARCGVWEHRDAVCSTWWCRHERGAVGARYWWAMRYALRGVEHALALWCCTEEGLHTDQLIYAMAIDGVPRGASAGADIGRAEFWGKLAGDEEGFYVRCWERVRDLSWDDVLRIGGPDVRALALHVLTSRRRLDEPVPDRLVVGTHTIGRIDDTGALVETYSPYDPVGLHAALIPVLHRFDGRPVAEVLAELSGLGLEIDPAYLRELVDFGVLVGA